MFDCAGMGLQFLSDTLIDIHTLQNVFAECWKESHDREGDVLLVLLESPPETETGGVQTVHQHSEHKKG